MKHLVPLAIETTFGTRAVLAYQDGTELRVTSFAFDPNQPRGREYATARTLYVRRDVLNAEEIREHFKAQGFDTLVPADDMHVTIAFSKAEVDWNTVPSQTFNLTALADARSIEYLGPKGAIVMKFDHPDLRRRWGQFLDAGCSWDWDSYHPHVTLTYENPGNIEPAGVAPWMGAIELGPEKYEPLDEHWASDIKENRFDPTQARIPKGHLGGGRWTSGASAGVEVEISKAATGERAFEGEVRKLTKKLTKQEVGAVSEAIAVAYLRRTGFGDAHSLNFARNNFPLDLVDDHKVFEVKGGLASNSHDAQKWRLTIGEPGVKEKAWLAKATPEQKARFNDRKMQAIFDRKAQAMREVARTYGKRIKGGETITMVLDPDRRLADIYRFAGFHTSIRWSGAEDAYQGTVRWKRKS